MRKDWISVSKPPRTTADVFDRRTSAHVLGYFKDGQQRVVVFERHAADCAPAWYTTCSEHWDVTRDVLYWKPLGPGPSTPPVTRRRLKVLALEFWMRNPAMLEDSISFGPYRETEPRMRRPGIYLEGKNCWFETEDGRAFTYRVEDFLFQLGMLDAERITRRQAAALAAVVLQGLATAEQEKMLRSYRDMMEVRATGRGARKHVMSLRTPPVYDYYHVVGPNGLNLARVNCKSTEAAFKKAIAEVALYTHTPQDKMAVDLLAGAVETGCVEVERQLFERAYAGEETCKDWTLWEFTVAGRATLIRRPLENTK